MSKVYLAIPGAPDRLLGRISEEGKVYQRQTGPDDLIGRVELPSGDVYQQRFGPDKKIGRVDLEDGRVFSTRFGPDDHVGQVDRDGRISLHIPLAIDDYVARVEPFVSFAHSAGGLLLLALPALEKREKAFEGEADPEQASGHDPIDEDDGQPKVDARDEYTG